MTVQNSEAFLQVPPLAGPATSLEDHLNSLVQQHQQLQHLRGEFVLYISLQTLQTLMRSIPLLYETNPEAANSFSNFPLVLVNLSGDYLHLTKRGA